MANYHGKLTSAQDIAERCIVRDTLNGQPRVQVFCGPNSADIAAFQEFKNPAWTRDERCSSSSSYGAEWSGTETWAGAVERLRLGWPKGTKAMRDLSLKLTPRLPVVERTRHTYRPSVVPVGGVIVSQAAMLSGSPTPYLGRFAVREKREGSKIVRLGVNVSVSSGVDSATILGKGAAVLALINALKLHGKAVDVTILHASTTGWSETGTAYCHHWHVAPSGSMMNLDQLAMAIANNAGNRRFMFAMTEHLPGDVCPKVYGNYGMPASVKQFFPDVAKQFDILIDSDCMITRGTSKIAAQWSRPEDQVAWVLAELAGQGIA